MEKFRQLYTEACDSIEVSENFMRTAADSAILSRRASIRTITRRSAIALIAAALAIVMAAGSVIAAGNIRRSRLSDTAQFGTSTNEYVSPVGQSVTSSGITLVLDEVIYDNGILYVSLAWAADEYGEVSFASANDSGVKLDGRRADAYSVMSSVIEKDGESFMVFEYDLGELTGMHDAVITFECVELMSENGFESVYGKWKFKFSFDASALTGQTVVYPINERITLENGDVILLDKIVCSPVSQYLEYEIITAQDNSFENYILTVSATDDLGGRYEFLFHTGKNNRCTLVNTSPDEFSPDAQTITLNIIITDRYDNILMTTQAECKQ